MIKKRVNSTSNHIESVEYSKCVTIVRLRGNITFDTLKTTQDEFVFKTKGKDVKNILFDLKKVSGTDTSGIAALIDLFKYMKAHQTGGRIGLINVSPKAKDLFIISKTQSLFSKYPSEEEAIENLR